MKKTFIYLSVAAAIGGLVYCGTLVNAQTPTGTPPAASPAQPMRPRIALVNIAKVLREFQKASADGKLITAKRQEYMDRVKPLREKLAQLSRQSANTLIASERENLQKQAVAINRQVEDVDQEAQRILGDLTDKTIVEVYQNIKAVINDIAVTNNLDLVMCYPDASTAEDEKKPAVAQLKLQAPALIPFYHRNMDITEVVVVTLNRRHPAPPETTGIRPATSPMGGGVTPTGFQK